MNEDEIAAPAETPGARARAFIVTRAGYGYAIGTRIAETDEIPDIRRFAVPVAGE